MCEWMISGVECVIFIETDMPSRLLCRWEVRAPQRRIRAKQWQAGWRRETATSERVGGSASVNFNDSSNSTRRRRRTNERNPFDEITNEPASAALQCQSERATNWRRDQSDGPTDQGTGRGGAVAGRTRGRWTGPVGRVARSSRL